MYRQMGKRCDIPEPYIRGPVPRMYGSGGGQREQAELGDEGIQPPSSGRVSILATRSGKAGDIFPGLSGCQAMVTPV